MSQDASYFLRYIPNAAGGTSYSYRFYSVAELPPSLVYPFSIQAVQSTFIGVIGKNAPVLQLLSGIRMGTYDTVTKCPVPPFTLCRCITPRHAQVTTLYTPWTTPSVSISQNPSARAHGEMVRGGNFKHFNTFVALARNWTYRHYITSSHTDGS